MKQLLIILILLTTTVAHSQTRQPFSNIGKKVKVVTLSNGKYDEFFDEDTLQRVGSSVININKKKITKINLTQAEIDELENTQATRFLSVDPLTKEYPMLSPYPFAENQPIWAIDIDGLEKFIVINYLNKKNEIYKTEIRGIRSIDGKNVVNLAMKNAHGKSLTTKEVFVINKLANGKFKDIGGKNSLSVEEQKLYSTAKNAEAETNLVEPIDNLPYQNNISDNVETEKDMFKSRPFDGDKYSFFGVTKKVSIPKTISNPLSNSPRIYHDNDHFDVEGSGNLIIKDVNKIIGDFKAANPKATDIKTTVNFTTISSNALFVFQVAKRLESLGIKTNVIYDNNYKSPPVDGNKPSKQDFNFSTNITGVIK
jgi:hypothetical protein